MKKIKWYSLKIKVFILVLLAIFISFIFTLLLSYFDAHEEIDELFDAQMSQAAQTLLLFAETNPGIAKNDNKQIAKDALQKLKIEVYHKYQSALYFQIWNDKNQLILVSENAPIDKPLTDKESFSVLDDENGHWRLYTQWNAAKNLQVQIKENHTIRDSLIIKILSRLFFPALASLPFLAFFVWFFIKKATYILDQIAYQVQQRKATQLTPLEITIAPKEIKPLIEAINNLFLRVEATINKEREFTANAAHELRTPLAVLKTQIQILQNNINNAEQTEKILQVSKIEQGINRSIHLVEQMLILSRLENHTDYIINKKINLENVITDVCAELADLIFADDFDFCLNISENQKFEVVGEEEWIKILLRNLLKNAMNYTPKGGKIIVNLEVAKSRNNKFDLTISDSGIGISDKEKLQVFNRFYQVNNCVSNEVNAPKIKGCGLGLAIVKNIADLHNFNITLKDAEIGGLEVKISGNIVL